MKPTDYVTGCALLIKKEVVDEIGWLDEDFFMYYEDIDWNLRAKEAGYKIVVAQNARIWHKVSSSTAKEGEPWMHYYHIRNALLLTKKHAPPLIKKAVYLWSWLHYFKQAIKLVVLPSQREVSRMIMRGIRDFHKRRFGKL